MRIRCRGFETLFWFPSIWDDHRLPYPSLLFYDFVAHTHILPKISMPQSAKSARGESTLPSKLSDNVTTAAQTKTINWDIHGVLIGLTLFSVVTIIISSDNYISKSFEIIYVNHIATLVVYFVIKKAIKMVTLHCLLAWHAKLNDLATSRRSYLAYCWQTLVFTCFTEYWSKGGNYTRDTTMSSAVTYLRP